MGRSNQVTRRAVNIGLDHFQSSNDWLTPTTGVRKPCFELPRHHPQQSGANLSKGKHLRSADLSHSTGAAPYLRKP
jgi:hypothetical protein